MFVDFFKLHVCIVEVRFLVARHRRSRKFASALCQLEIRGRLHLSNLYAHPRLSSILTTAPIVCSTIKMDTYMIQQSVKTDAKE